MIGPGFDQQCFGRGAKFRDERPVSVPATMPGNFDSLETGGLDTFEGINYTRAKPQSGRYPPKLSECRETAWWRCWSA